MANEKNAPDVKNIQEDEDGTRKLLTSRLPKDTWGKGAKGSNWYDWTSHPLLLLIVGALITSWLFPYLTRGWQDHQRALDLKASLVDQINESTESAFAELETVESRLEFISFDKNSTTLNNLEANFVTEYHNWRVKGEAIEAELSVYFEPNTNIASKWQNFAFAINYEFYLCQQTTGRETFISYIKYILRQFHLNDATFVDNLLSYKLSSAYGDNLITMNITSWYQLERTLRINIRDKQILPLLISTPILIRST